MNNDLNSGNPTNQGISVYKWLTVPNRVCVGMKGSLCAHRVHNGDHMRAVQKMISQRSFKVYLEVSVLDNLPIKRLQQSDSKWGAVWRVIETIYTHTCVYTIHNSALTIHNSGLTIHNSALTIHNSALTIHNSGLNYAHMCVYHTYIIVL